MTIERLDQFINLKNAVDYYEKKLNKMKSSTLSDTVKGSSLSFPFTEKTFYVEGADNKGIINTRKMYQNRKERLQKEKVEIELWIDTIKKPDIQLLLTMHYIDGVKWKDIPKELGLTGDGSTEQKKVKRFFDKLSVNSVRSVENVVK